MVNMEAPASSPSPRLSGEKGGMRGLASRSMALFPFLSKRNLAPAHHFESHPQVKPYFLEESEFAQKISNSHPKEGCDSGNCRLLFRKRLT
jgi:hypothetical protein